MASLIFCLAATLPLVCGKPAILPVAYNSFSNFHAFPSAVPYATNIFGSNHLLHNAIPYPTLKFEPVAPQAQVLTPSVHVVNHVSPVISSPEAQVLTPTVRVVAPVSPIISKYHAQAEDGSYSFGYHGGPSSRAETRDNFGIVRGAFNYVDSEGKVQTQQYVADALGFRVAGTNIPVVPETPDVKGPEPVGYTPEVQEARAKFFEAFKKADEGHVEEPVVTDSEVTEDHAVEVVHA